MNVDDRLAVIGAGTMGHGIAQVAATAGYETVLVDVDAAALARGMRGIEDGLARAAAKGKLDPDRREAILGRIWGETDLDRGVGDASIAIEAVPENLDLKRGIFRRLEGAAPEGALLATNTSSLPIGEIAAAVSRPGRVVGMHFFNPVPVMALLEVVRGEATAPESVARATAVGERMGKECIVVRDSPGFATSRLGVLLGLEAIRMVEDGVASAEDIDKAMTLGYRHPIGPLRLTDLVGLDVRLAIAEHLHRALGSPAFAPPRTLREMVAAGTLGKKTGRGFYTWD
jgi:3-hydroxybutyryl-CoA dehydrogenase